MIFRPTQSREELESLRIAAGDMVVYDGALYRVRAVGLKYAYLEDMNGKQVSGLVHLRYVQKHDPDKSSASPFDCFSGTSLFDRNSLLK